MDQAQKDLLIKDAEKYKADDYLAKAVQLLFKNKKIKIEIVAHEWDISNVSDKLIFKLWYSADGHEVVLNILESVFKDYNRDADKDIGIKNDLPISTKIILRLAYLLYKHRND